MRTFLVAPPSCLYSLCLYGSVGTPAEGACHGCAVVENKRPLRSSSRSLNRPGFGGDFLSWKDDHPCRSSTRGSVAVAQLIRAAATSGWNIAISSDFEPRGLHGAITLLGQVQRAGQPWRLTTAEYLAGPVEGEPFGPRQVPDTPWDPALADAMRHRCERVSEEARLAHLLNDLNRNLIDDKIGDGG